MKFILTTLLIASTVGALKNLVDLSAARSNRLHHLLKDGPINAKKLMEKASLTETTAHLTRLLKKGEQMNDHHEVGEEEFGSGSGSGSGSGPDPEKTAVVALAHVIQKIRRALKTLKDAKDKQDKADAEAFLNVLKHGNVNDVKEILGQHAMERHVRCQNIKKGFANYIHKTELINLLANDNLNFEERMGQVLKDSELNEQADVFEAFVHMAFEHDLLEHPGVKAVMEIGGMLAETYCDTNMDGLANLIIHYVDHSDPRGKFDVSKKINPYVYAVNSGQCMKRGLFRGAGPKRKKSLKEKALDLVFENHNNNDCGEVKLIRSIVRLIHEGVKVHKKSAELQYITQIFEDGMKAKVKKFMEEGQVDKAFLTVGQFVVDNMRGAIIIGTVIEKYLKEAAPPQASAESSQAPP